MFVPGGIYAELMMYVVLKLQLFIDLDAMKMISFIKMSRIFEGFGDSSPADTEAIRDLLLRLFAKGEDIPQNSRIGLKPVKIMPEGKGYWIEDVRIMLR
jgi:hypothetical protein